MILTWNLRDFPESALSLYRIRAETPDKLLSLLFATDKDALVCVLREARLSLKEPPISAAGYLEVLRVQLLLPGALQTATDPSACFGLRWPKAGHYPQIQRLFGANQKKRWIAFSLTA